MDSSTLNLLIFILIVVDRIVLAAKLWRLKQHTRPRGGEKLTQRGVVIGKPEATPLHQHPTQRSEIPRDAMAHANGQSAEANHFGSEASPPSPAASIVTNPFENAGKPHGRVQTPPASSDQSLPPPTIVWQRSSSESLARMMLPRKPFETDSGINRHLISGAQLLNLTENAPFVDWFLPRNNKFADDGSHIPHLIHYSLSCAIQDLIELSYLAERAFESQHVPRPGYGRGNTSYETWGDFMVLMSEARRQLDVAAARLYVWDTEREYDGVWVESKEGRLIKAFVQETRAWQNFGRSYASQLDALVLRTAPFPIDMEPEITNKSPDHDQSADKKQAGAKPEPLQHTEATNWEPEPRNWEPEASPTNESSRQPEQPGSFVPKKKAKKSKRGCRGGRKNRRKRSQPETPLVDWTKSELDSSDDFELAIVDDEELDGVLVASDKNDEELEGGWVVSDGESQWEEW